MNQLVLTDEVYVFFVRLIYEKSGIALGEKKRELVKARLMKRLIGLGMSSYRQYYDYVSSAVGADELIETINAISTNVTAFFREIKHFEFMENEALPKIVARKKAQGDKRLRMWSTACSSGEEVYTMLMVASQFLGGFADWDIKVLGTDISTKVLSCARQGVYSWDQIKPIPAAYIEKYFDTFEDAKRQKMGLIKSSLRDAATFRNLNLLMDSFPFKRKFDIIFCRNVMIYFDKQTQGTLIRKLYDVLDDDGYLCIGYSENIIGAESEFIRITGSIFKKRL